MRSSLFTGQGIAGFEVRAKQIFPGKSSRIPAVRPAHTR